MYGVTLEGELSRSCVVIEIRSGDLGGFLRFTALLACSTIEISSNAHAQKSPLDNDVRSQIILALHYSQFPTRRSLNHLLLNRIVDLA